MVRGAVTVLVGGLLAASNARVGRAQSVSVDLLGGVTRATLAVEGATEASVGARYGAAVGARVSVGLTPTFSVVAGALYVQKGGTTREQGIDITRDDFNFWNFPLLARFSVPFRERSTLMAHLAVGPALEPDFVWGGAGVCLMALAGLDLGVSRSGAILLEVAYNHGLYDMQYATLEGRPYRNRTFSLMVGYSFAVRSPD